MISDLKIHSPTPLEATDLEGIKRALSEDGVAVVKNILQPSEQDLFLDSFWEAIQARHNALRRDDPSTWVPENTDWHGTFGAGQYKHYGMAQEKHCWLIRKNETIRHIFEQGIFASSSGAPEPCCVSLDGCAALFRPTVSKLDMHVDLVPNLPGSDWGSVQGAYNLYEVQADAKTGKATSGFVCVVGSHRQYESMWNARRQDKFFQHPTKHWHKLEADSPLQHEASLVTSPANSLVLWRSDLLHKNYGGDFTAEELGDPAQPRLPRLTQFITFSPKKYRTEEVLHRKALAVVDGVCNNHWAALSFRVPIIPFPAWTPAAKNITVIRPFSSCHSSDSVADESNKEVTQQDEQNKRVEGKEQQQNCVEDSNASQEPSAQSKKRRKGKNDSPLRFLPEYIQEIL